LNKTHIPNLSSKVQSWLGKFDRFVRLDSNGYTSDKLAREETLIACGIKEEFVLPQGSKESLFLAFRAFLNANRGRWIFGHMSYEAKDIFEITTTSLPEAIGVPVISFFVPEIVLSVSGDELRILSSDIEHQKLIAEIIGSDPTAGRATNAGDARFAIDKETYIECVRRLIRHIYLGDIYEVNFCQTLFYDRILLDPFELYLRLKEQSAPPFGAFYKIGNTYLCCASPERFIAKRGPKLICQPIKGTNRRAEDEEENKVLQHLLYSNQKERSENVMIVDLMRNDLSRICMPGSVKVEELYGIYAFRHVNQMISTIVGETDVDINFADAMKALYPMGSMTGAPKISSLELIDRYESHQRGLFSGTIGYIDPQGDWDFNVIIRSVIYDDQLEKASVSSGGAITALSVPEDEYNESLLKMEGMMRLLGDNG